MSEVNSHDRGAVLFDLDGTLVDTAPDMVRILQSLQRERSSEPVPFEVGRSYVSNGVLGLLSIGFPDADDELREDLRQEFLERYAERICDHSVVFDGLDTLLGELEAAGIPWGVVTNKPASLTDRLLDELQLSQRAACAVSGDTLPQRKPHPAPLLHACEIAAVAPAASIYVGDAARDIEAGRAAGMSTIAAGYGYIIDGDDPAIWGADSIAVDTQELAHLVRKAVKL